MTDRVSVVLAHPREVPFRRGCRSNCGVIAVYAKFQSSAKSGLVLEAFEHLRTAARLLAEADCSDAASCARAASRRAGRAMRKVKRRVVDTYSMGVE